MQDRICRIDENLLHRAAGPYMRVILDRTNLSCLLFDVRFDLKATLLLCALEMMLRAWPTQ